MRREFATAGHGTIALQDYQQALREGRVGRYVPPRAPSRPDHRGADLRRRRLRVVLSEWRARGWDRTRPVEFARLLLDDHAAPGGAA